MILRNLNRFQFLSSEAEKLRKDFILIHKDVRLHSVSADLRSTAPTDSGCYFWTMRHDDAEYKIYIGRTRSLRKRLTDYANEIQIHAPNDYKLRFFQEFIHEVEAGAAFDLYFQAVGEDEFKRRELDFVKRYQPFVNFLRRPTADDRARIRDGLRAYYREAFAHRLADA